MKTLKFNKKSWHYKLAAVAGYTPQSVWNEETEEWVEKGGDICSYSVYVGKWFLLAAFCIMFIYSVIYFAIQFLFGVVFSIMYMTMLFSNAGLFGFFIFSFFSALAIIVMIIDWTTKATQKTLKKPDSFISNAYRAWKDKFCVRIEFN